MVDICWSTASFLRITSFSSDVGTLVGTVDSSPSVVGITRQSAGDRGMVTLVGGSVEEATAYQRLMNEFGHTQDAVSKVVGKSRSHVTNLLRLLSLPEKVQTMVGEGALSMGHARALIGAADPLLLAKRVVDEGLSVRQTEALANEAKGKQKRSPRPGGTGSSGRQKDADTVALEKDLTAAVGMKVAIDHEGEGGKVVISYETLEDLDELCSKLGVCGF